MITQSLSNSPSTRTNEHPHIRHSATPLRPKETSIALHKLDEETFYLMLKIGSSKIHTAPRSKINRTKVKPDLLTFSTANWAHVQRLGTIIKKARITEISDQSLS
jgi:hypothetical protein